MSYYTIQTTIFSLFIILFIHYVIEKLLQNDNKIKKKPKVLFKLPVEEENIQEENKEDMTDIKQDMKDMKQELLKFIDTNEIYNDPSSKKKDVPFNNNNDTYSISEFDNKKTDLTQFFKKEEPIKKDDNVWCYNNENTMNSGIMGDGLSAFDETHSNLASY